jgi:hypothetical protein
MHGCECCKIANEYNNEAARRSVAAGCAGLWVSDDYGDSCRGLLRLEHFRRYVFPAMFEVGRTYGAPRFTQ